MKKLALVAAVLAATPGVFAQIRFENRSARAGIHFVLSNGAAGDFHQIELMPGGVAALDYNNDGCIDVFFTNGATSPTLTKNAPSYLNRLYRNNCNGTFTDVTLQAGVGGAGYSMGVAAADYDNDGFTDLFVAGVDRNILYHNRGNGTFEDVTAAAGLTGVGSDERKPWSVSAGWFDADNDGKLDLFVANYVQWDAAKERPCGPAHARLYCHPDNYAPVANQIFRNNGDGTFTDMSASSGIGGVRGKGMGVAFGDFDGDGRMDIFVANDSVPNFLFHNLGGFRFQDVAYEAGVALPEAGRAIAGMGTDFRDFDNDGWPDIIVTGMVNDAFQLFRNLGKGNGFEDYSARAGLALTRPFTGWGVGLVDFDNDGFKDLFFANSHFPELGRFLGSPAPLPNRVFRNNGSRFVDVSGDAGADLSRAAFYRGAAFADFDNDGRVDVVVSAIGAEAVLLRNVTANAGHHLGFRLRGVKSNRDGIGASIRVTVPDGRGLFNTVTTSVGYASSSDRIARFGLGAATSATEVEIRWPGGGIQTLHNIRADQIMDVREDVRPK